MISPELMKKGLFWTKGIMLVDGCTKVSPGCKNCWSEALTARFNRVPELIKCEPGGKRLFNGKVRFNLHLLEKAAKVKKPQVYAIWNDLYHEGVTIEQVTDAHVIMANAKHHTWLIVTKRPHRASSFCSAVREVNGSHLRLPDNMWHIVTCENQAMADKRIPHLLNILGKRGVIIEPMLEGIDLLATSEGDILCRCPGCMAMTPDTRIDQVILGPENGTGKRPFDALWAEDVQKQCESAGVPFYRKDTGTGSLAWNEAL